MFQLPTSNLKKQLYTANKKALAKRSIIQYKSSLLSYLAVRCHNIYDALDIWQEVKLQVESRKIDVSQSPLLLFKVVIKLLNNPIYKNQYSQVTSMNMENELNEVGLDKNNFWVQVKQSVSAQAYDMLWFFYMEKFSINEISTILNKNCYWVKLMIMLHEGKLSKKYNTNELLSICLLKV
jgi:hypothetical protein